jgi:hypothetical protein
MNGADIMQNNRDYSANNENTYTVLLVAKLSIRILAMAILSFSYNSSDPSGAFTIESIKNDSNKYLSLIQVSFLNI